MYLFLAWLMTKQIRSNDMISWTKSRSDFVFGKSFVNSIRLNLNLENCNERMTIFLFANDCTQQYSLFTAIFILHSQYECDFPL